MKKKIFSILFALVLAVSLSLVMAAPVAAVTFDLAVNDENPWTDGAFTFENISPGGDPMAFDFKLHNVGDDPGILTFSMSVSENDMAGAPAPNMSADEFASLVYVEAVHYQFKWPADPEKQPEGYVGAVKDDLPNWLAMDFNSDGKVSLYEICQAGTIPYSAENDPLDPTAEITYFIEFQLGDSLGPFEAGGDILTGVEDNSSQGDGVSVTIIATLGEDIEESSGNVFQAAGVAGPVLNSTTDVTYTTIQAAVDAASPGDTIIVHEGTYAGFNANIQGITVKAASKPVINGAGISYGGQVVGILVTADDVTIQKFKVTGPYSTGIWVVDGADDAQILGNTVDQTGFDPGALAGWDGSAIQSHGDDTVISNNRVKFGPSSRPHNGINVFYKDYTITKNTVTIFEHFKYQVGINVRAPATIENNRVVCPDKSVGSWTRVFGIWLYGLDTNSPASLQATVAKNRVTKADYGVWLSGSKWNSATVIEKNTLVNDGFGIVREHGANPTIQNNNIKNWWWKAVYP